jgi:hypothetical protein
MNTSGVIVQVSNSELHGYALDPSNDMIMRYQWNEVPDKGKLGLTGRKSVFSNGERQGVSRRFVQNRTLVDRI